MQQQMEGLTPAKVILERKAAWADNDHKDNVYQLRLIAANFLDIGVGGAGHQVGKAHEDVEVRDFEEGSHNPVTTNTQIQAKSLAFNAPDFTYRYLRPGIAEPRRAWYGKRFKEQNHGAMYRMFLLESVIGGAANLAGGVRGGMPFLETADDLLVTWDPMHNEMHRKRGVFRDKHMTAGEAIRTFPALEGKVKIGHDGAGSEKPVTVTCYWDKGDYNGTPTYAVIYNNSIVQGPEPSKYGDRLPMVRMEHFRQPSVKHATGPVTEQIGSMILAMRLQRGWREVALRAGSPALKVVGKVQQGNVDKIAAGEEGQVLVLDEKGDAGWMQPGEISESSLNLYNRIEQNLAAESGVNQFMQGRTDTNVDFASQLSFLAAQGGTLAKYCGQQLDEGVLDAIDLLMHIGSQFAPDEELYVGGELMEFGPMFPLRILLGTDGEMMLKPGGMEYRPPAQKLQEVAVLGNVLALARSLPPGLGERFVKLGLTSFEIEDADDWENDMRAAMAEQLQQETAIQMAQAGVEQGAPAGMSPQPVMA